MLKYEHITEHDLEDLKKFYRSDYEPITYFDSRGREQQGYRMSRNGFTMLIFGYEGILARLFKLRYMERFDAMEATLRRRRFKLLTMTSQQIDERVKVILGETRSDMTLTHAYNLLVTRGLHIPPISRDNLIKLIKTGVIEGYFENRQWHVYQDSFANWLERRKLAA